jgi:hypothetical protein
MTPEEFLAAARSVEARLQALPAKTDDMTSEQLTELESILTELTRLEGMRKSA